ncbi:MAG: triose-phosphate isomerase [Candidatus Omnitrophica bacterium]|nr:triose-phosphate isomerase [Candidatus Omnitrophota bacterium]MCF7888329.1 triose-phosphate isomerase [Candidatus Omnitrophota bacterium]
MRRPFIAGNWKMNKTAAEAADLASKLKENVGDFKDVDILICPPYTSLVAAQEAIKDSVIDLGAQNMHWEAQGAFTGEISPAMLKGIGAKFVIIGHSERRKYFSETNQEVNKKIKAAISADLLPIVCIGETLEQREKGQEKEVIENQLKEGFDSLSESNLEKITVAYEPVWAIGTGKTATGQQAEQMHSFIRNWFKENFSDQVAEKIRLLYGGSVKPVNIKELISNENIDGALVGGASLKAQDFTEIIKNSSLT